MKEQALWLYQRLTRTRRSELLEAFRAEGNVPVGILFYHRIADTHPNGWTMSCGDFARQLDWLQANFDIVTLEEAQSRIQSPFCDRPTIAITFDDGYSDNANFAIPELAQRNLPATYFVSTEFVRTGAAFPHDKAAECPLDPNTIDELRKFASCGIEIGAHTKTHCDMGLVTDPAIARDEILGSVDQLERWLGREVHYFAFPFGLPHNTSQLAVDIINDSKLKGFCTAYGAWNWPKSCGKHLRRIHADPGLERLKNWLTFDSRKLQEQVTLPFSETSQAVVEEDETEDTVVLTLPPDVCNTNSTVDAL